MIRDRLQTTLLEEAQDTIAHLTVENRRLTDTVSFLEHELEAARARLDERSVSTATVEASTAGVDPSTAPSARQVLLLQQQLVEKEAQLQVLGAQQRILAENVDTLEAMLQDKRRSEMGKAPSLRDAMREEIPSRHLHASSSTDVSAETTNALAGVVRKLQEEARHARESERNYARMVDALQQELLFTQRQLMKTRRAPCDTAQLSAPPAPPAAPKAARGPPRLPPSLIPSLVQQCEANTSALSEMELTVSALQDRCANVTHWDAEIITFLQTRLAAKERELAQLRQQSFASEIS